MLLSNKYDLRFVAVEFIVVNLSKLIQKVFFWTELCEQKQSIYSTTLVDNEVV